MDKDFYLDSAREAYGAEQPEENTEDVEEIEEVDEAVEEDVVEEPSTDVDVEEPKTDVVEIDGVEYTLEEVKNGMLRQQDYTRKTQELSAEKSRLEQAQYLNEFITNNPHVLEQIRNSEDVPGEVKTGTYGMHPIEQEIINIRNEMEISKIEREIESLSERYPDFNEMEVLRVATEMGVNDLEFVYKATREVPDEQSLINKAKEEAKAEIMKEINENKGKTKTLITNEADAPQERTPEISSLEASIAKKMGVSVEDYLKYK